MLEKTIVYVADKILGQIFSDGWTKKVKPSVSFKETYQKHLKVLLYKTIDEFEEEYPYDKSSGKFPFYQSQILFDKLTSFVLFKQGTKENIIEELKGNPKIIIPSDYEIKEFYKLFYEKIEKDEELKVLFVEENYKSKIFENADSLENLQSLVLELINKFNNNGFNKLPKHLTNDIPKLDESEIVGRKTILEDLYHTLFKNEAVVVVNGLGGIGKTTIAQVFVGKYYSKYEHIIWLTQIKGNDIYTQFASAKVLRNNLQIDKNLIEPKEIFNEIIRKLNQLSKKPNLLIIDNADNSVEGIRSLLPDTERWHTLITSRNNLKGFTLKPLGFLSEEDAFELFVSNYTIRQFSDTQIKELIKSLDYHTLSIDILSKTANLIEYDFEELINAFKKNIEVSLDDVRHSEEKELEKINNYLAEIFELSNLDEQEIIILKRLSVLPSNYLEYSKIKELIVDDPNFKKLRLVLENLHKRGWLLKDAKSKRYKLHLIIAETVKKQPDFKFEDVKNYIQLIISKLSFDQTKDNPVDKFQWIDYGKAILQSIEVCPFIETEYEELVLRLQNNLALVLQDFSDYEGAKILLEKAKKIAERNFGKDHPNTARSYSNLATVLQDLGDYQAAKLLFEKVKRMDEKNFGKDHPTTAICYSNLAGVLLNLGDYQGAKVLFEKVKKIDEKNFGKSHPSTAASYSNLAIVLKDLGDYQGARGFLEKAKKSNMENFGEDHPVTARSYSNLATVLQDLGDYQGAKALLEKTKISVEKNFGEEHPTTALTYSNLALVLKDLGDYQGAKVLLEKAKKSNEKNFGEDHPTTALTYSNMAVVLKDFGNYQEAKVLFEKAVLVFKKKLGEQHPTTKMIKENLEYVTTLMK